MKWIGDLYPMNMGIMMGVRTSGEVLCDAAIYVELGPRSPVNKGPRAPIAPHKNQPHSSVGQAFWWLTKGGMSMLQNFYDSRWHVRHLCQEPPSEHGNGLPGRLLRLGFTRSSGQRIL